MPYKDPEKAKINRRKNYLKNLEKQRKYNREYKQKWRQDPENRKHYLEMHSKEQKLYRKNNPEKIKKTMQSWLERNPNYTKEHNRYYRKINREILLIKDRERYSKNREEFKKSVTFRHSLNKIAVMMHYSKGKPKCVKCKEDNLLFLNIDHIRGRKAEGHDSKMTSGQLYRFLLKNNFPKNYQVLCFNHNLIKEIQRKKNLKQSKVLIRQREYTKKIKLEVLSKYSKGEPKCSCCGFKELDGLVIDHIIPVSKTGGRNQSGGLQTYLFLRNDNYPKNYQVLCHSCNSAKSSYSTCPHNFKKI